MLRRILNGREIRRLKSDLHDWRELHAQARESCENAIKRRDYRGQHKGAKASYAALHQCMRLEERIRELAS